MTATPVAAVDLGATSGRVMIGRASPEGVSLQPVARFPNGPVAGTDGHLYWDYSRLTVDVMRGLDDALAAEPSLRSIGIDSWAADYGLIDASGRLLNPPHHYRDARNVASAERVHSIVPFDNLYHRNGLQFLPFTTLYQLAAEPRLDDATRALLIPDLLANRLTGAEAAERTNASTTGLLDVTTGQWDENLIATLKIPRSLLPDLVDPGTVLGTWKQGVDVLAVGSHDTASAVVAVPTTESDFAYVSCGTWGLVGVELDRPVLTGHARAANFTNERGVDGRIRFLHNVMGLWLLSETLNEWGIQAANLPKLLEQAAQQSGDVPVFDPNDPAFVAPGGMTNRIRTWLLAHDQPVPTTRPALVRCILESLAVAFAESVRDASRLAGIPISAIHIVGGGSQNQLLCQRTSDLSGVPVLAGPTEATAIGNTLVQARAYGSIGGSLEDLRSLVRRSYPPRLYLPGP